MQITGGMTNNAIQGTKHNHPQRICGTEQQARCMASMHNRDRSGNLGDALQSRQNRRLQHIGACQINPGIMVHSIDRRQLTAAANAAAANAAAANAAAANADQNRCIKSVQTHVGVYGLSTDATRARA